MIFQTQNSIPKIIQGIKRNTRRLRKPGDYLGLHNGNVAVFRANGTVRYEVGHTYSVQPGRTKPAVWWNPKTGVTGPAVTVPQIDYCKLRICITDIRREDVRNISQADAEAEGYIGVMAQFAFWEVWAQLHDKKVDLGATDFYGALLERPAALYDAWALTFCIAK